MLEKKNPSKNPEKKCNFPQKNIKQNNIFIIDNKKCFLSTKY